MTLLIYSPGNLRGIGLLTIAASMDAVGVVDLAEMPPGQWGHLHDNLSDIIKFYPAHAALGFRIAPKYFDSLTALADFPDRSGIFFILSGVTNAADLQFIRSYSRFKFYVECYSPAQVRAIDAYREKEEVSLSGYVAVSAEAGGRTGSSSMFILLQEIQSLTRLPVFLRGGIGLQTAGILPLLKIKGLVLDDSILLFPGSPLGFVQKETIARLEGREFEVYSDDSGCRFRIVQQHWAIFAQHWIREYERISAGNDDRNDLFAGLNESFFFGNADESIWPVGQMVGMAEIYRKRYGTLQRFITAIRESITTSIALACRWNVLSADSTLSREHKTTFPIVQGPMTRVSDTPEFGLEIAKAGGLAFMALALYKGEQLSRLLDHASVTLADKPWGAGILGFAPLELIEEQFQEVIRVRPPYAIIAGGSPAQAKLLEKEGIRTYIHAPVPALLRTFIRAGATRFIFEGRECGGHVGPFYAFPLWEQMITTLLEETDANDAGQFSVLFAGGIGTALSSAMVSVLSSRLSAKGVKVGILMGTAYLACKETVETCAITHVFQEMVLNASDTTLLTTSLGHSNRCIPSPFSDHFQRKRRELLLERQPNEKIAETLDSLLLGRLKVASKGVVRKAAGIYEEVSVEAIAKEGMFMAGEVVRFLNQKRTIADLHNEVTAKAGELLRSHNEVIVPDKADPLQPVDVAIVGMSLFVPGANDVGMFWDIILNNKNTIKEIPAERWDWKLLFDEDPKAEDRAYSRWGGFIDEVMFDPIKYGIPPKSIPNISTAQLLALENVTMALEDAGIEPKEMDRENTSVIFATTDSGGFLSNSLVIRSTIPFFSTEDACDIRSRTQGWNEETFPGILGNVVAGRIANRLDFGGRNYVVDAACASSLVAVDLAVRELTSKRSKIVVAGGIDVGQTPFGYLAFSKTAALSPTGESLPFDKRANGIVLSEGSAVLILKRLEDAEKDGDKIYAVLKGIAGSSDGRAMGMTAPRSDGQQLSISRAYKEAGFGPGTIDYCEAHGTGTMVGDSEELNTICTILKESGAAPRSTVLSSVKSLIGHTKMAAGMVGLAKTALSLYYKVLPPHANINEPLDKAASPDAPVLFLNKPAPWLAPPNNPRRAGVSAFGFGGTNFHAALEEYGGYMSSRNIGGDAWPEELLLFGADSREALLAELQVLAGQFTEPLALDLRDLAWSLTRRYAGKAYRCRLAFTASETAKVSGMLNAAIRFLQDVDNSEPPLKMYYKASAQVEKPKVAFLFSGQGSQYVNMGREMSLYFSAFRNNLELANQLFQSSFPRRFSDHLYPEASFERTIQKNQETALNDTHIAQPAIGVISVSYLDILSQLGINPDLLAGHSFGEITALHVSGAYTREDFFRFAEFRGLVMSRSGDEEGAMAAIKHPPAEISQFIEEHQPGVVIANYNAPDQTVISGPAKAIRKAIEQLTGAGISCIKLPVSTAFHSPMMEQAARPLNDLIRQIRITAPKIPVFSNTTGKQFPKDAGAIREMLCDHLMRPVQFRSQIEEMYAHGARIFVELGPNQVLSGLIARILQDKPHKVFSADGPESGVGNFLSLIGKLWVENVVTDLTELFRDRKVRTIDLNTLGFTHAVPKPKITSWLLNGHCAKPVNPAFQALLPKPILTSSPRVKNKQPMNVDTTRTNPQDDIALTVYRSYEETMRQFLKTQEQIMRMFLEGGAPALSPDQIKPPSFFHHGSPDLPMEKPHDTASSNGKDPDSNGKDIDSNGKDLDSYDAVLKRLLTIISEKTGYPEEMISDGLDLEADLSVDSIKRMEILGNFISALPVEKNIALSEHSERFLRIKKLKDLVDAITEDLGMNKRAGMPSMQVD